METRYLSEPNPTFRLLKYLGQWFKTVQFQVFSKGCEKGNRFCMGRKICFSGDFSEKLDNSHWWQSKISNSVFIQYLELIFYEWLPGHWKISWGPPLCFNIDLITHICYCDIRISTKWRKELDPTHVQSKFIESNS